MLWIILAIGILFDFYYGIKLLSGIYDYHYEIEWCKKMSTERSKYIPTVEFPTETLRLFIIILIICVFVFILIGLLVSLQEYEKETSDAPKKLVAINTKSMLKGHGGGSAIHFAVLLESKNVYSYYYLMQDGGYHREDIEAEHTYIYEKSDCKQAFVEKHKIYQKYKNPKIMYFLLFLKSELKKYYYVLTVPSGSILHTYNFDL